MYQQMLYVFQSDLPLRAQIRSYQEEDFEELIQIQRESFPPPFPSELWWNEEQLHNHVALFPQGALLIEVDGQVAGSITSLITHFNPDHPEHTWAEVTDNGYIRNHSPSGDTLYVVDLCIRPSFRGLGLGKYLLQALYHVVVQFRLQRLLGGARMPGYHHHAQHMRPEEYLDAVVQGKLKDPVITFMMRCGRVPIGVVPDYLEDEESCNYAALMAWRNPFLAQS